MVLLINLPSSHPFLVTDLTPTTARTLVRSYSPRTPSSPPLAKHIYPGHGPSDPSWASSIDPSNHHPARPRFRVEVEFPLPSKSLVAPEESLSNSSFAHDARVDVLYSRHLGQERENIRWSGYCSLEELD
jgi:hypothetical protein